MVYQRSMEVWVVSKELEEKYNKALERIRDLETKLYYCLRNKKLTTCNHCNRNDGTCGCANRWDSKKEIGGVRVVRVS